ncbi:Serine/threonineprotein kinase [Acanthamoeba castellanii str. Neff]|uniref:non-specific serine/threonine protein kinase n=1 Tax=Acanthamoeba castellanii (strain ATCC 30010 / Neff) TaxID=1257118 RepID=L8H5U8_ACACF|nr:Serine/threonineprotein kinase [Acanthamoeba castellanii str. Neff]ELR20083.1 Serine/threonineprotein kinase [Acanthamoeba castellanii str. Neff]
MEVHKEDPEEVFEMLEKLGEGSFGVVCKCRSKKDNKIYAVKVIEVEGEDDSAIRREIDIFSSLCDSDLVVRYGGCYRKGNNLLIAMEYCDAGSVQDVIKIRKRQLTEDQIAAICAQVVHALVYLHSKHVMHRDIKSGNILLTESGTVKLADFGVSAKLQNTMAKKNTVIGSPYWMAPEYAAAATAAAAATQRIISSKADEGYDMRADIWSLGITAIEMADTEPPRYDIHYARVIFIIAQKPPPTFKNEKEWSAQFLDFTAKCLQKDPKDRPTAKELLSRGMQNKAIVARLVGETLPLLEKYRREKAARGPEEQTDTFEDSDTIVRGMATVEIRGGLDETGNSGTFVETDFEVDKSGKGYKFTNLKV